MQQHNVFNSSESARLLGLNNTTIQRAIQRGELAASRPRDRAAFQIERAELLRWAADKGYKIHSNGELIDPATGEIVEPTTNGDAQLAAIVASEPALQQIVALPASTPTRVEPNVSRVLLPSADAGLLEAARRLVALPESPQLWEALRAVLGVESPAA